MAKREQRLLMSDESFYDDLADWLEPEPSAADAGTSDLQTRRFSLPGVQPQEGGGAGNRPIDLMRNRYGAGG